MGVKRLDDLDAFQLAVTFKRQVYQLVDGNPRATADWGYRNQLFDAAVGGESEAQRRLRDGVDRGYFTAGAVEPTLVIGGRAIGACTNLWKSLQPFIKKKKRPGKP